MLICSTFTHIRFFYIIRMALVDTSLLTLYVYVNGCLNVSGLAAFFVNIQDGVSSLHYKMIPQFFPMH